MNLLPLIILVDADAGAAAGAGIFGGILSLFVVFWIVFAIATIFWLWMLIDAITNEPTPNDKILWFLVIFFLHIVGALIYFVVRRSSRTRLPA